MAEPPPRDPIAVLSIDGGGIRGLIPALVGAEIEARTGRPLFALFDLIAGTSTGGLLALGLTAPEALADRALSSEEPPGGKPARYRARDLAQLYIEEGPRIFQRSLWRRVRTASGLIEEKYADDGLEEVLEAYFGDARLSEALTEVLVTAYAIERREAYFFKRYKARRRPAEHDFPMRAVARATSAAPTYFEPARLEPASGRPFTFVDGGVYAGNPALCAYAEAVEHFNLRQEPRPVLVVSLGTGTLTRPLSYRWATGWGTISWAQPVLDIALHGMDATVDYQLRHLLPMDDYYRFQTRLTEGSDDLDDTSPANLRALRRRAQRLIEQRSDALDALAERLTAERV